MLGPLEVVDGGRTLTPTPAKHRVVLAALILEPGRVVPVEELVAAVWGAKPPRSAEPVLRVYVSALRKLLGAGLISTVPGGYRAEVPPEHVDAGLFRLTVEAARRARAAGSLAEAADRLRQALALWRGEALAGIASDELRRRYAPHLEESRLAALEERIDLDLALGRHPDLPGELRRLIAAHPLREKPRAQLMYALNAAGRRSEALEVYAQARRTLVEELGVEPGPLLRAAHQAVLSGEATPPGLMPPPAAARPAVPPAETPPDLADFTGRERALAWIRAQGPGVLVLHGAAGVGKTALAVRAANALAADYPDGRLYAVLRNADGGPRDTAAVVAGFLRSLGCPDPAIPPALEDRVRLYRSLVAGRRLLLVLDDAPDEAQVRPLLPASPGCLTLVTSRSPLAGLESARAFELRVLPPDEALTLLARVAGEDRVRAEPEAAKAVVALCGRLPLAVRIAGARLARRPAWTLDHLVRRLIDERHRLDELTAGDLAVRSSLLVGYRDLAPAEALLFRRLGLLSAPSFAAWVAGPLAGVDDAAGERLVERLVDAGLLQPVGLDEAGQERYRLHDLTRLFARELDEERRLPAAFAERVLALARTARSRLVPAGPGSGDTVLRTAEDPLVAGTREIKDSGDWLAAEHAFLADAVADLARYGRPEWTWRLAFYLADFFEARGHLADWTRTHELGLVAAREAGSARGRVLLLRGLAAAHRLRGRSAEAERALAECLDLVRELGDPGEEARVMLGYGLLRLGRGRTDEAEVFLSSALAAFEAGGDRRGVADALRGLGVTRTRGGDAGAAVPLLERSVAVCRDLGDRRGEAVALCDLAEANLTAGAVPRAAECAERATGIGRRLGDPPLTARGLLASARVALREGRTQAAASAAREAEALFSGYGDRAGRAEALLHGGQALMDAEDPDGALRAATAAEALYGELEDAPGLARALRLAAEAYLLLGRRAEAEEYLRRHREITAGAAQAESGRSAPRAQPAPGE